MDKNFTSKFLFISIFLVLLLGQHLLSQNQSDSSIIDRRIFIDGLPVLTDEDLQEWKYLPVLNISPTQRSKVLPVVVDNSQLPYFRPIFNQTSLECGQAAGVAYLYTYEIDRLRNLPANVPDNQYPTHFVFNWSNGGSGNAAPFFDSWNIIKELGTPNVTQYGGGLNTGGVARWMNGYDLYYASMKNRLWDFYRIPLDNADDLQVLKHWIDNHCNNEETGGVAVFYASYMSVNQTLPPGTPEAGKYVLTILGNYANHALTVVGYHDSIRYDINGDGMYTNHLDINGDGTVDILDWEIGGVKIANSYSATSWGNQGYAYLMYSALCRPLNIGGVWNRSVYVIKAIQNSEPQITYKAKVKHNSRELVKVMAGVASGYDALAPEYIIEFPVLNYQGGNKYMQGGTTEADKTLEFGLDVTRLLHYLPSGTPATYFFLLNEKDPSNNGTGSIINFSLIDYTNGVIEYPCPQSNVPIVENGLTMLKVNATIHFTPPCITVEQLNPATINEPYQYQMTASCGTPPYQWKLKQNYSVQYGSQPFPNVTAQQLTPSHGLTGFASKTLDFQFPFYDKAYNKVYIHTDGYIMFTNEPYPWTFLVDELVLFKNLRNISPFMAKTLGVTNGGGMWYEGNQNYAIFRWKATEYQTNNIANFAVKLYPSGVIEFFYGNVTVSVWNKWHAGVSAGDDLNYELLSISNTYNLPPNTYVRFEPQFLLSDMKITESGLFYGTPTRPYEGENFVFCVKDANGLRTLKTLPFFTDGINKIVIKNVSVISGNDPIIEYGETAYLTVQLQNLSDQWINASSMTINTSDIHITLIDPYQPLGAFAPGQIVTLENAFSFSVSPLVPNNHQLIFSTQILAGNETYNSHIYLKAYAPVLSIGNISIIDNNNGYPEPGETVTMKVNLVNSGGGKAYNVECNIVNNDPFISLLQNNWSAPVLAGNSSLQASFLVQISELAPNGHLTPFLVTTMADGGFSATYTFLMSLGMVVEDFETGNFNNFNWTFSGTSPWTITNQGAQQGQYCMRSGQITHNQFSTAKVTLNVISDGNISFYFKVSSEANYDFLVFSIDNTPVGSWSGNVGWTQVSFPVTAGERTFSWRYEKDYSISTGSDCAWVDFIVFPPIAPEGLLVFAGPDITICENQQAQLSAIVVNESSIIWTTSGDGYFSNVFIPNPVYYPGNGDINSGLVTLTITAYDNSGNSASDQIQLNIQKLPLVYSGPSLQLCQPQFIQLNGTLQNTSLCQWFTSGDGVFSHINQPVTKYYPGPGDFSNGYVQLTLSGFSVPPCSGIISHSCTIQLLPLPQVSFGPLPDFCVDAPPYPLTEGSPAGGIYSGPGVSGGWFYASSAGIGTHIITYTYTDSNGCQNSASQTVVVDECLDVVNTGRATIKVYPNPSAGIFYISASQIPEETIEMAIKNIAGKELWQETHHHRGGDLHKMVFLPWLSPGIYYLTLRSATMQEHLMLILKK